MPVDLPDDLDPLWVALSESPMFEPLSDLVRSTGAQGLELRVSQPDDASSPLPPVYVAVAGWCIGPDQVPVAGEMNHYVSGADPNPLGAIYSIAEKVIDGGTCVHCGRPSGLDMDFTIEDTQAAVQAATGFEMCWVTWDPELSQFRRGCAGG